MSIHRPRRIGRTAAQRLLRGETAGFDRLAELLATAAAPAERDELLGEEAAVSVFREARLAPVLPLRKQPMIRMGSAKPLTLKVAAAVLTVTAAGGVALAAGTGKLPGSGDGAVTPTTQPAPGDRPTATPRTAKPSPTRDRRPDTTPSTSVASLCHAYRAGDNPGKALDKPAFTHLITVAGGKDKVTAYCTGLLKTHPAKGRASSHPTGAPSTHPTAAPPTHPTGRRTTHPAKATHPVH